MPNHVINEIIFRSVDAAVQDRIVAQTCDDSGKVDFQILVPLPLNMWWGNVGQREGNAFGDRTALDWARANWGTKWNAYDHKPTERTDHTLILRFETAWGPPYPWLAAVLNSLKLPFEHNWLSEGGGQGQCGVFRVEGKLGHVEWTENDASPEMHRHLHKLLWGVEEFEDDAA